MASITRRLPQANIARLKAINTFKIAYDAVPAGTITLSPDLITDLPVIHTAYNAKFYSIEQKEALLDLAKGLGAKAFDNLYILVIHFLQVLRLTVNRSVHFNDGDWEENDIDFYNLDETGGNLPLITTDEVLLIWANHVVTGEANRKTAKPTAPDMTNPTAVQVNALIAPLIASVGDVAAATTVLTTARQDMNISNPEVDRFILSLWNFLDANASGLEESARRNLLRQFGVVYISTGTPNIISAHIKRADNTPIEGATATIEQTGATANSNADGLVEVSSTALGNLTVLISFPGFTSQNLPINVPDNAEGQTFDLGVITLVP